MISRLRQLNHWSVFPRSSNTMLRAISKAALSGWDILRLSIDTYSKHAVAEAYQELSIREDTLALPVYNDMDDMDFTQNALQYHLENLKAGKASGIITVSSGVVSELEKRRIHISRLFRRSIPYGKRSLTPFSTTGPRKISWARLPLFISTLTFRRSTLSF